MRAAMAVEAAMEAAAKVQPAALSTTPEHSAQGAYLALSDSARLSRLQTPLHTRHRGRPSPRLRWLAAAYAALPP